MWRGTKGFRKAFHHKESLQDPRTGRCEDVLERLAHAEELNLKSPGGRSRHWLCHPSTIKEGEKEALAFLGVQEMLTEIVKEILLEDMGESNDFIFFEGNIATRRANRRHVEMRKNGGMRALLMHVEKKHKAVLTKAILGWKKDYMEWRRDYDLIEKAYEIEEKEQEILRLNTEIVQRDATLYLQSPDLTGGAVRSPMMRNGRVRVGKEAPVPKDIYELAREGLFEEFLQEEVTSVVREAYADAFGLPQVAQELYMEMLGHGDLPLEYTEAVGLQGVLEAELVDSCGLAHQMVSGMVFQSLVGVLRQPVRQDFVWFQDFAEDDWFGKLMTGAILLETGKKVQEDWSQRAKTTAVKDCATDELLTRLAEYGGWGPGEAKVLMAETATIELSAIEVKETSEAQEAMAVAAEAAERLEVAEDEVDVAGYLAATRAREEALAKAEKEQSEAVIAIEDRKAAELALELARADMNVEQETGEAVEAREAAELAADRFEKAIAIGDLEGINEAQCIADEAVALADKEELEAIQATCQRKISLTAAEVAAVSSLVDKHKAAMVNANNGARLAETKRKAILSVGDIDEIAAASTVAEDARIRALQVRADYANSNSRHQQAKVKLTAAKANAIAEKERFEARVAGAAVTRAEQKLALANDIGSLEDVKKAEIVTKNAWDQEEREFKEAQEADKVAMAAAKAVLRSQEEEAQGGRMFEEGIMSFTADLFGKIDLDGNECVDQAELAVLLQKLLASTSGRVMTQAEVEAQAEGAMRRFDVDKSGKLDFGEFMALITQEPWSLCLPGKLQKKLDQAAEKAASMAEISRATRLNRTRTIDSDVKVMEASGTPLASRQATPVLGPKWAR